MGSRVLVLGLRPLGVEIVESSCFSQGTPLGFVTPKRKPQYLMTLSCESDAPERLSSPEVPFCRRFFGVGYGN